MKKRSVKKIVTLLLSALVVAGLIALPFVLDRINEEAGDGSSILSTTVVRGDISRTVSGAGTLEAKDSTALTVPAGVVITAYTVSDGDLVKAGDPIAAVDTVSVYKTAATLADSLAEVTQELAELQNTSPGRTTLYANFAGTVTALYARTGDDVRQVVEQYGALCEVRLDNGTVLTVTATSGTVAGIYIQEGRSVYEGASLFLLDDVDKTGGYGTLVLKRREIEEQMGQLFQMLRDGYAAAPCDGMVTGTDESLVTKLAAADGGLQVMLLADTQQETPTPDRTEYLSGLLSSALDADAKGTVSGINGPLDFSAFPTVKPGDTVFVRADTYILPSPSGGEDIEWIEYTVLLTVPAAQSPAGQGANGGGVNFGGATFNVGGMTAGNAAGSAAAAQGAETSGSAPTTIAALVPTDEVRVKITVDELDILSLHVGDAAQITIDALPGRAFAGVVTAVNTGRSNSGGNSKYNAEVTVPLEADMLAGMNASCLITVETFRDVLSVPSAAICDLSDGPVIYTAVSNDGKTLLAPVPVTLGLSDGESVEILSGLEEGQLIWYSTYDTPEFSLPAAG